MKTTIELPDPLFRAVKAHAAQEGLSLKVFFERAVTATRIDEVFAEP